MKNNKKFLFKVFKICLRKEENHHDFHFHYDWKKPLFDYEMSKDFDTFHVRSSHEKTSSLDRNKKLIVFLKHGDRIYSWRKLSEKDHQKKPVYVT